MTAFVQGRHPGLVLTLLPIALLLAVGGFGPPLLGATLGAVATRVAAPFAWRRARLSREARRFLRWLWPLSSVASLAAWLPLFPGSILLDHFAGSDDESLPVATAGLSALGLLSLTVFAALACGAESPSGLGRTP